MRYFVRFSTMGLIAFVSMCLVSFSVLAEKNAPEFIDGTKRVTAEEVVNLATHTPELIIIDARKASDRESAGWIEGSIGLPNYDTNEKSLAQNIPSKSTPVLFYCNGVKCGRSVESSKIAVGLGYKNIYWFRGGWEEWMQKGLPVSH